MVVHTVREVAELAYRDLFEREIREDPLIGELAAAQLRYLPTVTRERMSTVPLARYCSGGPPIA